MKTRTALILFCLLPLSGCYIGPDPYYDGHNYGRNYRHDYGYERGPAWGYGYGREEHHDYHGNGPSSFRHRGY